MMFVCVCRPLKQVRGDKRMQLTNTRSRCCVSALQSNGVAVPGWASTNPLRSGAPSCEGSVSLHTSACVAAHTMRRFVHAASGNNDVWLKVFRLLLFPPRPRRTIMSDGSRVAGSVSQLEDASVVAKQFIVSKRSPLASWQSLLLMLHRFDLTR